MNLVFPPILQRKSQQIDDEILFIKTMVQEWLIVTIISNGWDINDKEIDNYIFALLHTNMSWMEEDDIYRLKFRVFREVKGIRSNHE